MNIYLEELLDYMTETEYPDICLHIFEDIGENAENEFKKLKDVNQEIEWLENNNYTSHIYFNVLKIKKENKQK